MNKQKIDEIYNKISSHVAEVRNATVSILENTSPDLRYPYHMVKAPCEIWSLLSRAITDLCEIEWFELEEDGDLPSAEKSLKIAKKCSKYAKKALAYYKKCERLEHQEIMDRKSKIFADCNVHAAVLINAYKARQIIVDRTIKAIDKVFGDPSLYSDLSSLCSSSLGKLLGCARQIEAIILTFMLESSSYPIDSLDWLRERIKALLRKSSEKYKKVCMCMNTD